MNKKRSLLYRCQLTDSHVKKVCAIFLTLISSIHKILSIVWFDGMAMLSARNACTEPATLSLQLLVAVAKTSSQAMDIDSNTL